MKHSIHLVLLALAGCGPSAGQPIVVVHQELTESLDDSVVEPPPTTIPTLAVLPELRGMVAIQPSDLMTSTWRTSPSIVLGPGTEEIERALREPGRVQLREYPDGETIPFTFREGSEGYGGQTRYISIEPERELRSRWYVLELNVRGVVQGARPENGTWIARFRPDSYPVFQRVLAGERDGVHILEARFSQHVAGDVPAREWRVSDEEGDLGCSVVGPAREAEADRAVFTCARRESGTVRIDFGGVLTGLDGAPLRNLEGEMLSEVSVEPTGSEGGLRLLEPRS